MTKFIKPIFTEEGHRYDSSLFKPYVDSPTYLVSSEGVVLSTLDKNHIPRLHTMVPKLDKDGYPVITIKVNGLTKTVKVHRLVAITYIPNPDNKPQVNHKDGCKTNNNVHNLEWNTCRENVIHSVETGLRVANKGSKHGLAKLNEANVLDIRARYATKNITQKALADEYGVSFQTVSDVVNRKLWNHL